MKISNEDLNPYEICPVYESEHFIYRLVQENDAKDLLKCYSDKKSQQFFNSDNCINNFNYETLEEIQKCISFWLCEYKNQAYIRFSIVDKSIEHVIGTIEMFGKIGIYNVSTGLLRIDICSEFERDSVIDEVLGICVSNFYKLFDVDEIVTKAIPEAASRIKILINLGFVPCEFRGRTNYYSRKI